MLLVDADLATGPSFESLRTMANTFCVLLGYDYSIVLPHQSCDKSPPPLIRVQSSAFLKKPVKSAALLTILEEAARAEPKPSVVNNGKCPFPAATCKNTPTGSTPPRHALRILVAEDNPSNQFVLRKYLVRIHSPRRDLSLSFPRTC